MTTKVGLLSQINLHMSPYFEILPFLKLKTWNTDFHIKITDVQKHSSTTCSLPPNPQPKWMRGSKADLSRNFSFGLSQDSTLAKSIVWPILNPTQSSFHCHLLCLCTFYLDPSGWGNGLQLIADRCFTVSLVEDSIRRCQKDIQWLRDKEHLHSDQGRPRGQRKDPDKDELSEAPSLMPI